MYVEMLGITKQGVATQSAMCQHCDRPHNLKISRTICFSSCNLPFCGIGNIFVTFIENSLLITLIHFVIEAQIHTNSYITAMSVMSSRITGQSTVSSTFSSDKQHRNIKGPYYRPFGKGIHGWRVDSSPRSHCADHSLPMFPIIADRPDLSWSWQNHQIVTLTPDLCLSKTASTILVRQLYDTGTTELFDRSWYVFDDH